MVNTEDRVQIGLKVVAHLERAGLPPELLARIAGIEGDAFIDMNWHTLKIQLMYVGRSKGLIPPRPTGSGSCVAQASQDATYGNLQKSE